MTEIKRIQESSRLEWEWLDIKIVSDVEETQSIKNEEDKTREIVENYVKNNLTEEIEKKFNWEIVPKIKNEVESKVKKEVDEKVREESNKMFTLFWVFASVVAFLLVEVQVLKTATSWQLLAWLSLILLWSLSFFIAVLNFVLKSWDDFKLKDVIKTKSWILLFLVLFLLIWWIWLSSKWDEIKSKDDAMTIQAHEQIFINKQH